MSKAHLDTSEQRSPAADTPAFAVDPGMPPVLALLAPGDALTGPELARRMGISRAAVWKQVEAWRNAGLEIESGMHGYRLRRPLEPLDAARVRACLPVAARRRVGVLENHWRLDSTSSELARRAAEVSDSSFVFADWQQAGRGRRGRQWLSPPVTNLQFSCLKRFAGGYGSLAGLSLVAGIAAARALEDCGVHGVGLKWPNDLVVVRRPANNLANPPRLFASGVVAAPRHSHRYASSPRLPSRKNPLATSSSYLRDGALDDAKLGGILVELGGEFMGPCHAIVGIGINVYLPDTVRMLLDRPCADIAGLCVGKAPSRNALATALVTRLIEALEVFDRSGFTAFSEAWAERDALTGCRIHVKGARETFEGIAAGVDARGALQVRSVDGLRSVDSAEVTVRPT